MMALIIMDGGFKKIIYFLCWSTILAMKYETNGKFQPIFETTSDGKALCELEIYHWY